MSFEIKITTIEEFIIFAHFVQGKELDIQKIKELTQSLNASDKILEDAINAQKEK